MKNVGNSSDGHSQGVPKISGHLCIGRIGALRGHLCDSTAFLLDIATNVFGHDGASSCGQREANFENGYIGVRGW